VISEARRLQYLDALGIDAWVSRSSSARQMQQPVPATVALAEPEVRVPSLAAASYIIGPGSGQTLLLCNRPEEAASKLASDIARCLDEVPVWGWQTPAAVAAGAGDPGLSLETAIRDRLFTRVLLFGAAAKPTAGTSEVIGCARIIHAPALAELGQSPQHKRSLWLQLVANGWCKTFA
jgi:hypothetical protein